jgi:hypothetical protein
MSFEVVVDPRVGGLTYDWSTSRGVIENGQGTNALVIRTYREDDSQRLDVKVLIVGLPDGCESSLAGYGMVAPIPDRDFGLVDDFRKLKPNDMRARLDSFFIELINNPNDQGLVVFSTTKNEPVGIANPRMKLVMNHARFRKFDLRRLVFHFKPEGSSRTRIYRFRSGTDGLPCSKCSIILGRDLK